MGRQSTSDSIGKKTALHTVLFDDGGKEMKTNNYNRYSYSDLMSAATKYPVAQIDIDTLGAWFQDYAPDAWNGEYYDVDGLRLRPVYEWDGNGDIGEIAHYELY
jgi:hypothetical protein